MTLCFTCGHEIKGAFITTSDGRNFHVGKDCYQEPSPTKHFCVGCEEEIDTSKRFAAGGTTGNYHIRCYRKVQVKTKVKKEALIEEGKDDA